MEIIILKVSALIVGNFAGFIQPILEDVINRDIHDDRAQFLSSIIVSLIVGFFMAYPHMMNNPQEGLWPAVIKGGIFFGESLFVFLALWKKHPLREKLNRFLYGPTPDTR